MELCNFGLILFFSRPFLISSFNFFLKYKTIINVHRLFVAVTTAVQFISSFKSTFKKKSSDGRKYIYFV